MLVMLRLALDAVGEHAAQTSIGVEAAEDLSFIVTGTSSNRRLPTARWRGDLSPLLHRASQAG